MTAKQRYTAAVARLEKRGYRVVNGTWLWPSGMKHPTVDVDRVDKPTINEAICLYRRGNWKDKLLALRLAAKAYRAKERAEG